MPIGFRSISGLNNARIAGGLNIGEIPGDGGAGPTAFIVFLSASGLVPGTGTIELLSPTNFPISASGADGNGNLSVTTTWVNSGDDIHFNQSGGGSGAIPDGFWAQAQLIRGTLSLINDQIAVDIQFGDADVLSFPNSLTDPPTNPNHSNDTWDGSQGQTTLEWDAASSESPIGTAIIRNGVVVASIPYVAGANTFIDTVFASGDYIYEFAFYKYPDEISPPTAPFTVSFGGSSTFEMTGSGGFDFGGSALFQFLVDPSGIYKLTSGKTHDTIYDNSAGGNTTVNVKIP